MTVTLIEAMAMADQNDIQDRIRTRLKLQLAEMMEDLPNG